MSKQPKVPMSPEAKKLDSKMTQTAFLLIFPMLILAIIAVYYAPLVLSIIAIALTLYQFLMLKQFIQDYYKK